MMNKASQVNTKGTSNKLKQVASQKNKQEQQNNVAPANQKMKQGETLVATVKTMTEQLEDSLPDHIKPERMMRIALTAIRNNPKLSQCDKYSFLGSLLQAAQLGLEPNTSLGEGYIIPYFNKERGEYEASFQMGYQGLLSLAHRTNKYARIYAHEVYENDHFEFELGLNKKLVHVPADIPEGEPVRYYACYHLTNGGHDFFTWSKERVEMHKEKFSQSSNVWNKNFDSMAKKTMLKEVLRYAPKSVELAEQLSSDGAVISIDEQGNQNTTYVYEMESERLEEGQGFNQN